MISQYKDRESLYLSNAGDTTDDNVCNRVSNSIVTISFTRFGTCRIFENFNAD